MITFITDDFIIDPLGIMYLSAMLKQEGIKTGLCLTDEIETKLITSPIVAYSVTTGQHRHYAEINRWVKELYPNIISLFGGPHCTFFPDFARTQGVDFIFRGEGFIPIVEFVKRFRDNPDKRFSPDRRFRSTADNPAVSNFPNLYDTPNMAYYIPDDDFVITNDLLPPFKVSELPFPDRELVYQYEKKRKNPIKNVMASFGCPFDCTYCYNKGYRDLGYTVRTRPVEDVIVECEKLVKDYPSTQLIFFQDDIFPIYRNDWLTFFCEKYLKRVRTPFHIQFRVEFMNEDKIKMLKLAGLHGGTFAIETANICTRQKLLNRKVSNKQILECAKLFHEYSIRLRTENMLGLPYETFADALATLELNLRCNPDIAWASLYTPYPGTELGDYCQKAGIIDKLTFPPGVSSRAAGIAAIEADFFTNSILNLKDKERIKKLHKLFSLFCACPFLYEWRKPLAWILTTLPFKYRMVYNKVKQYLYDKRLFKI